MEPSDTVYSAVRIKKEHIDEWPTENDGGNIIDSAPDDENQLFGYRPNGSHVKSSHDITHSCETCGKTFRQRANLKAHIDMTHRSERIDK
ncbi:hypothetical protein TKK_0007420 [Trichogramma kaykai]